MKTISIMQDNLKDHVDNLRDDFELYDVDLDSTWNNISGGLEPERKPGRWKHFLISGIAASLLLITGFIAYQLGQQNGETAVLSEWQEVELFYQQEINMKMTMVKQHVDDPLIMQDLESIDEAFAELKADLKDNIDNEEVIEAMMDNYRLKLRILEKILAKMDDNGAKKENMEISL